MAIEPAKISELTQVQRNALIAALGCKTIHRMNYSDSLPDGFEPDEIEISFNIDLTDPLFIEAIPNYAPFFIKGFNIEDNPYFQIVNDDEEILFQSSVSDNDIAVGTLLINSQHTTVGYYFKDASVNQQGGTLKIIMVFIKLIA